MSDGKTTRRELAEAVEALRAEVEQLRAERAAHTCHGHSLCCAHAHGHCNWGHCGCFTVHGWPYPLTWTYTSGGADAITCGTGAAGTGIVTTNTLQLGTGGAVTQGAAGYNPGYTVSVGEVVSGGYSVSASN